MSQVCEGAHHYFVAEVIGVESEGTVHILALCTACGETLCKKHVVAAPFSKLILYKEKEKENQIHASI